MLRISLRLTLAILLPTAAASGQDAATAKTAPLPNPDPVVTTGATVPGLLGQDPDRVVAFAVRGGGWHQIPVQIDERAVLPFAKVLRHRLRNDPKFLFYTDAAAATGADPDPTFDRDDELVFLAEDGGGKAVATDPEGVLAKHRVEVRAEELPEGANRFYLFLSAGKLTGDPGRKSVQVEFQLAAGSYLEKYNTRRGPNPESSTITTAAYRLGFSDRWSLDELRLTTPGAPGVDILDRHKVQVIPGNCIRTTQTFNRGAGAILANRSGPVRAIRSILGANSGPLTQRLWICYPRRIDIVTHLRVHALPSVFMFFDYSRDALGLRYVDNLNPKATVIDGKPDGLRPGALRWQFLTGAQGSLLIHYSMATSIAGLVETSMADDNATPKWNQCTGDGHAFGVCGPLVRKLPNTDPRLEGAASLTSTLVLYPGPPEAGLPTKLTPPEPLGIAVGER